MSTEIDDTPQNFEEKAKADEMPVALATRETGKTSRYLSASQIRMVLELRAGGARQVDIAAAIGCHVSSVCRALQAFDTDAKTVGLQLRAEVDGAITNWRQAKRIAAKRGDHRPAKELIEMAYPELRSQPGNGSGGGGVTVIVAVPGGGENPRPAIEVRSTSTLSPSVSSDMHKLTGDR